MGWWDPLLLRFELKLGVLGIEGKEFIFNGQDYLYMGPMTKFKNFGTRFHVFLRHTSPFNIKKVGKGGKKKKKGMREGKEEKRRNRGEEGERGRRQQQRLR